MLFLGTPEFAVPSLETLIAWKDVTVVGLVTQPDRPAGRGKNIFPPPTKLVAERHGIPVLQPEKLSKAPDVVQAMADLKPDILVTVAFGQILKKNVLEMARFGVMNVHGSLLPKLRGAAPINWSIINGDKITGVTTMYSDPGVDTGMMLLKREMVIEDDMDAEALANAMSLVGADLLKETLRKLMDGNLIPEAQNNDEATMAPRLTKEMGNIDWTKSAREIRNLVRGLAPWPGTYSQLDGQQIKILTVAEVDPSKGGSVNRSSNTEPGTILKCSGDFLVACGADGSDTLNILDVKPANKSKMNATSWANGSRLTPGQKLSMT
ncbi:MAG: methionyl-tRNA formyltransferase [Cyanobacteria bacterium]|nr:methionyl-tRNA formyltransferase [Cyanobacteriota bacterium]